MSDEASLEYVSLFTATHRDVLDALYEGVTHALTWELPRAAFDRVLAEGARRQFGNSVPPPSNQLKEYLRSLHLTDLALAVACTGGLEPAWELFFRTYRTTIGNFARRIAGTASARELADSVYADLYRFDFRGTGSAACSPPIMAAAA